MQNAIDAVRELRYLQSKDPKLKDISVIEQDAEVEVWLDGPDPDDDYAWFTINDQGIGMTEEVIRDYFLMAGASFRGSDIWKREFEIDEDDPEIKTIKAGLNATVIDIEPAKEEIQKPEAQAQG